MTCVNNGVYRPRVLYGDLDLTDDTGDYRLEWGYRFGNGVVVYDEIQSLLRDGTLVSSTRTGNRALDLSVLVKGAGSQARADAGALLDAEVNKQINTVTVYPADYGQPGAGPPLVLETFEAQSDHDWDGDLERAGYRRFLLNIPALPGIRSLNPTTINWTGYPAQLSVLKADWTLVSGSLGGGTGIVVSTAPTIRKTFTAASFLWLRIDSIPVGNRASFIIDNVTLNGVAVPQAEIRREPASPGSGITHIYTISTEGLEGTAATIQFRIFTAAGAVLGRAQPLNYPVATLETPSSSSVPRGIDAIDVIGTARTFCTIQFTAPAGGAFVLTGRDPIYALRDRGLAEMAYGRFTVASASGATISIGPGAMWFPQGTHYAQVGRTDPQPPALFPNGVWPLLATGVTTLGGDATATQYAYPADEMAQVSFFATSGAKTLISAQQDLPEGYTGGAERFADHILHPGRTMFAVLDTSGNPIAATVTYYPRWKHYPTQ